MIIEKPSESVFLLIPKAGFSGLSIESIDYVYRLRPLPSANTESLDAFKTIGFSPTAFSYDLSDILYAHQELELSQTIDDELSGINAELNELEQIMGMSSEDFYARWLQGSAADTFENNSWAILIKAKENLLGRSIKDW